MRTFLAGAGKGRVRGLRDDRRSVSLLSPPTIRIEEQRFGPGHCPCLGRLTLAHVTHDQQGTWTTSAPKGNSIGHHVNCRRSHRHSKFPAPRVRPARPGAAHAHPACATGLPREGHPRRGPRGKATPRVRPRGRGRADPDRRQVMSARASAVRGAMDLGPAGDEVTGGIRRRAVRRVDADATDDHVRRHGGAPGRVEVDSEPGRIHTAAGDGGGLPHQSLRRRTAFPGDLPQSAGSRSPNSLLAAGLSPRHRQGNCSRIPPGSGRVESGTATVSPAPREGAAAADAARHQGRGGSGE